MDLHVAAPRLCLNTSSCQCVIHLACETNCCLYFLLTVSDCPYHQDTGFFAVYLGKARLPGSQYVFSVTNSEKKYIISLKYTDAFMPCSHLAAMEFIIFWFMQYSLTLERHLCM